MIFYLAAFRALKQRSQQRMREHTGAAMIKLILRHRLIAGAALALHGLLFLVPDIAAATTFQGLYDTSVHAADRSEKARDAAFAEALGAVAIRVTGVRDAADRLGASLNGAKRYVQRFGYNADGTLDVGFDNVAVDQVLGQAGLPVWGKERPATLVWLVGDGDISTSSSARESVERAARSRGVPLVWPSSGEAVATIDSSEATLSALASRYRADAVLVGHSTQAGGPIHWELAFGGAVSETQGSLEEGIGFAADTYARVFATAPSTFSEIAVEVSGIDALGSYAGTLNYLEGLTLVRSTAVERVAGNVVRFKLVVRGDANTLRRAIALDHRLIADTGAAASGNLNFRYQP